MPTRMCLQALGLPRDEVPAYVPLPDNRIPQADSGGWRFVNEFSDLRMELGVLGKRGQTALPQFPGL